MVYFYFIFYYFATHCGGEISEKPSLWGIEISPGSVEEDFRKKFDL